MTHNASCTQPDRTAYSICREWRQVHLKMQYEQSMLDEHDEDGTARIVDLADATKYELERALRDASITTADDIGSLLGVALRLLEEDCDAERAASLIRLAKDAVYRGDAGMREAA